MPLTKIPDTRPLPRRIPGGSAPHTFVVDLPFPPSVNRIWRLRKGGNKIMRSKDYLDWLERADKHCIAQRTLAGITPIAGPFAAIIQLARNAGRGDLDNRAKCVLDWAQSRALIVDDKHCQLLIIEWTDREFAPDGCRLSLRAPPT